MLHNKLDIITTNMPQNQESLLHISAPNSIRIKELINGNLLDKEYISYLNNKLEVLEMINYDSLFNKMQDTPKQIVHGDFYLDNLIFTEGMKWKIIDYEQAGMFYKDYEIARALFMVCYNPNDNSLNNLNKIYSFLNGYRQYNSFKDINYIIELFLYSTANSLYCFEDWNNLNQSSKEFAMYKNKMLMWITKNKEKISQQRLKELYDIDR